MNAFPPADAMQGVRTKPTAWPLLLAAGLLVLVLLVRALGFVPNVVNPDESIFALAAREVVHGHLPYLTLFDNKPVGSTLIVALAIELLGQSVVAVRLVGALFVWLSALGIAALARRGGMTRAQAAVSALLYIAFSCLIGGFATLTETLLAPFTILAVLLLHEQLLAPMRYVRRLAFAGTAGLACGGAVLIKIVPIAPGVLVAAVVIAVLRTRRAVGIGGAAGLLALFAAAAATPMLLTALVYAHAGHFAEFAYSNFGFARAYTGIHPGPAAAARRIGTMADALWPLLGMAVVAFGILARQLYRRRQVPALLAIAAAWLIGETVAAIASLQFFPHHFLVIVPPLAVLAGYAIGGTLRWFGAVRHPARATALLGGLVAAIGVERATADLARDIAGGKDQSGPVAAAIRRAEGARRPTLFVTDYQLAALYWLTGAPLPPTRFAISAHLLSRQSAMIQANPKIEVARILASRPDYIVMRDGDRLPGWASDALVATLSAHHRRFYARNGITVFRAT